MMMMMMMMLCGMPGYSMGTPYIFPREPRRTTQWFPKNSDGGRDDDDEDDDDDEVGGMPRIL